MSASRKFNEAVKKIISELTKGSELVIVKQDDYIPSDSTLREPSIEYSTRKPNVKVTGATRSIKSGGRKTSGKSRESKSRRSQEASVTRRARLSTSTKPSKSVEKQISSLINGFWLNDGKTLNNSRADLLVLSDLLQKYTYPKRGDDNSEEAVFQKFNVFSDKLTNLNVAFAAMKNQEEIPDEVYGEMTFEEKIKSFFHLGDNWDEEGASAVKKTAITNALRFMRYYEDYNPCFVCATYEGNVEIDYKNSTYRIEAEIVSSKFVRYVVLENDDEIIESDVIEQDDFDKPFKYLSK